MGVAAGFTVGDHRTFNAQVAWTTKVDTMLERCRVSHTAFAVSISQSFHEARFHETSIAMMLSLRMCADTHAFAIWRSSVSDFTPRARRQREL